MLLITLAAAVTASRDYAERVLPPPVDPDRWSIELDASLLHHGVYVDDGHTSGLPHSPTRALPEGFTFSPADVLAHAANACVDFTRLVETPTQAEVDRFAQSIRTIEDADEQSSTGAMPGGNADARPRGEDEEALGAQAAHEDALEADDGLEPPPHGADAPDPAVPVTPAADGWTLIHTQHARLFSNQRALHTYELRIPGGRLVRVANDISAPGHVVFAPETATDSAQVAEGLIESLCEGIAKNDRLRHELETERIKLHHDLAAMRASLGRPAGRRSASPPRRSATKAATKKPATRKTAKRVKAA